MRTRKTTSSQPFDFAAAAQKAWAWLWAERQQQQANGWGRSCDYWVSATDLERRIRSAAYEQLHGLPEGECGSYGGGYGVRINLAQRGYNGRTTLLSACRDWLLQQCRRGILRADQPSGYRTVTGLRYRPVNAPLTPAEQQAKALPVEEKRRRACIRHFAVPSTAHGKTGYTRLCEANRKPRKFSVNAWRLGVRHRNDKTTDRAKVTCKRCLKRMAEVQDACDAACVGHDGSTPTTTTVR
jgi:hypothetical protein